MTARQNAKTAGRRSALAPAQAFMVQVLAQQFYTVVPRDYRTYCAFTARIACAALRGLGMDAELLPCQMWCVTPQDNYVVGFLDRIQPEKGRWNGHVVCTAGNYFLDAAVCNFERDFQLQVPTVVYGKVFDHSTTVIARVNLAASSQLWWHHPARGANIAVPDAPAKLVADFAQRLVARVRATPQSPYPAGLALSPLAIVTRPSGDDVGSGRPGVGPGAAEPVVSPLRRT